MIIFSILILLMVLLPGCGPKSFADYRLMEHIEENKVLTLDSDLELFSSLEHHRATRGQSKKGEQHKRRLKSLIRILTPPDEEAASFFSQPLAHKQFQITPPETKQPGLLRLGINFGHSSLNLIDVWR